MNVNLIQWKNLDKLLNRISLVKKITLLFIGSVMIPLLIQEAVYYTQTERNIQQDMMSKLNKTLDEKQGKITGALSGVLTLARTYSKNEQLYRCLDMDYTTDLNYLMTYQEEIKKLFEDKQAYYLQVKRNAIYTNNDTIFNGNFIRRQSKLDYTYLGETLLDVNLEPIGEGVYLRIASEAKPQSNPEGYSISILNVMDYYSQYHRYEKLLRADINPSYFTAILSENNMFDNMFLTDSEGRIILSAHSYKENGSFDYFDPDSVDKGMVILSRTIGDFPLTLYGLYDSKVISEEFRSGKIQSIWITLAAMAIALLCVLTVLGNITRRLYTMVSQSREIARGNFIQSAHTTAGGDEISVLESSINQMSGQLHELIEREYKAELDRTRLEQENTQAKLSVLQSQVNPHFMFNALESIRLKAMAKGETETAKMIKYMSRMFRNLINWNDSIIPLKDEFKFLDEFLHLQHYRFEDEFSYHIEVTEDAERCLVPKMMVQPLVENACVHGVEAITNDRQVSVSAWVESGNLELTVEDNGGGMTPERLENLRSMLCKDEPTGSSVGMRNVYRRLVLYYGENFTFDIDSAPGKGTRCRIQIPASFEGETRQ